MPSAVASGSAGRHHLEIRRRSVQRRVSNRCHPHRQLAPASSAEGDIEKVGRLIAAGGHPARRCLTSAKHLKRRDRTRRTAFLDADRHRIGDRGLVRLVEDVAQQSRRSRCGFRPCRPFEAMVNSFRSVTAGRALRTRRGVEEVTSRKLLPRPPLRGRAHSNRGHMLERPGRARCPPALSDRRVRKFVEPHPLRPCRRLSFFAAVERRGGTRQAAAPAGRRLSPPRNPHGEHLETTRVDGPGGPRLGPWPPRSATRSMNDSGGDHIDVRAGRKQWGRDPWAASALRSTNSWGLTARWSAMKDGPSACRSGRLDIDALHARTNPAQELIDDP